jgi:long-chain acyl-CoA synthetase
MSKVEYKVPDSRPWLKMYDNYAPTSLDYYDEPIFYLIDRVAKESPQKIALSYFGTNISYGEYEELINKFAHALQLSGIQKGDKILIMAVNCPQSLIAMHGAMKAGAIPVPLNPLYTAEELKYFFNDLKPRIVVTPDSFFKNVEEAAKTTPQIEKIISTNISDYFPPIKKFLARLTKKVLVVDCPQSINFKDFINVSPDFEKVDIDSKKDIALMVYTGGTTGEPKGVCLTHFNMMASAVSIDRWFKDVKLESGLLVVPLFHIYGCGPIINFVGIRGGKLVIQPKFSTAETLKLLQKEKVNGLFCVPAIYSAFIKHYQDHPNEPKLKNVTFCASGSTPISSYVWKNMQNIIPNSYFIEAYGLSETCPDVIMDPAKPSYKKELGSVGIPTPDVDVKIIDLETGEDLPPNSSGQIIIKAPSVFLGYWNKDEKTKKALKDGWFYTGDTGRMNKDGVFFVEGRMDDMINVRGENVWPREVEQVLEKNPKVFDVAVIGVKDEFFGQAIKACVVLKDGASSSEKELIDYCKESLVPSKVPHVIEFFKDLPKSNIGKTLHAQLRKKENNKK